MFRKIFTSTLLSLVIVGGFFVDVNPHSDGLLSFVSETYAAACGGTGQPQCTADQEMANMLNKLVAAVNISLDVLTFIVSPAIMLAGWLMSPDWTSGDLFKIRPILHSLWVLVSNITYFIYAILLIFIALATIFNSQNYGYKKLLPRLALGIVLVPLTWWFVQFIISLSTVITASVMNLPTDVMDKHITATSSPDTWWLAKSIPELYEFYTDPAYTAIGGEKQMTPGALLSPKDVLTNSSGIYGSLLVYGNGLFKVGELKKIDTTKDLISSITGLVMKGILSIIMFVVFGFLVIALIFMLLMRAIKLWFYAIFSPLLTLRYVVGEGLFGGKENADSFDIKEFIGLAFVPALVGLALSFGIVIIALLQNANIGSANNTCQIADMLPNGAGCKMLGLMGSDSNYIHNRVHEMELVGSDSSEKINVSLTEVMMGGIMFRFYGSIITDINSYANTAASYSSALSATGSVFGTLILDMIGLIFIWAGFMAAKNVSSVAKAAFAPFEAIGSKVGKLAMELPKYTPIPGTDGLSIKGAEKVLRNAESAIDYAGEEKFKNTRYARMFGGDKFANQVDMKMATDRMKSDKSGVFSESGSVAGKEVGRIMTSNAGKDGLAGEKAYQEWIDGIREGSGNNKNKARNILMAQGIDEASAGKIGEAISRGKNMADREMVDLIKGMAQSAKAPPDAKLPPLTSADSKGFNIGTVNISEGLSSDPAKIAAKLKEKDTGGGATLAGRFTEDEFRIIMSKADQFAGSNNKERLNQLVTALTPSYFRKPEDGVQPAVSGGQAAATAGQGATATIPPQPKAPDINGTSSRTGDPYMPD